MNKQMIFASCLFLSISFIAAAPLIAQTKAKQSIKVKKAPQRAATPKVTKADNSSRKEDLQKNADNYRLIKCMNDIEEATGYSILNRGFPHCRLTLQKQGKSSVTFNLKNVSFSNISIGAKGGIKFKCISGKNDCVSQGIRSMSSSGIAYKNTPDQNLVQCFQHLAKKCTP